MKAICNGTLLCGDKRCPHRIVHEEIISSKSNNFWKTCGLILYNNKNYGRVSIGTSGGWYSKYDTARCTKNVFCPLRTKDRPMKRIHCIKVKDG